VDYASLRLVSHLVRYEYLAVLFVKLKFKILRPIIDEVQIKHL